MEFFRLLCVFVLVNHDQQTLSFIKKSILAVRSWAIAALIPVGFLVWRLFIFHNERPATDVGLQLSYLFSSPLLTGMWWLVRLFQSAVNAAILAWGAPLFQNLFGLRLSDILVGVLLAGIAVFSLLFSNFFIRKIEDENQNEPVVASNHWQTEAIWIGLIGVVVGVLPVVLANRYVSFGGYSHYALPVSLASVTVVVGMIYSAHSRRIQMGSMSVLVLLAVLTQYTFSLQILHEEKTSANFWQQVVWRAPGIKAGTTLVVSYPSINYAEDVDAVAGPANFLYFPGQTNQIPATYQLVALPQMDYITKDVLAGGAKLYGYRTHVGEIDYENLLVISQASDGSCIHIIDPRWPAFSVTDQDQILLLGLHSQIQSVLTDAAPPKPAKFIFGPEPAHTWCYYYEKAELARQQGNWPAVVQLAQAAQTKNLKPNDQIEWLPFLQAYAILDDMKTVKQLATRINTEAFYKRQTCNVLTVDMRAAGYPLSSTMQGFVIELFCQKGVMK
jgi:hypothetical protein